LPVSPLPLHDALPISQLDLDRVRNDIQWLKSVIERRSLAGVVHAAPHPNCTCGFYALPSKHDLMMTYTIMGNAIALVQLSGTVRSEEHTSELQSRENL